MLAGPVIIKMADVCYKNQLPRLIFNMHGKKYQGEQERERERGREREEKREREREREIK